MPPPHLLFFFDVHHLTLPPPSQFHYNTIPAKRADDWNLAAPLKTCSLLVEQHGDVLLLLFRIQNPDDPNLTTLFAKAKIDLATTTTDKSGKKLSLEYFVESVVDSSRYFVVRILDERNGREAHIGFGFRDRDEATDFRESLNFYQKSIRRKEEAAEAMKQFSDDNNISATKLSLDEGEKIHINLGGKSKGGSKSTISKTPDKKITHRRIADAAQKASRGSLAQQECFHILWGN